MEGRSLGVWAHEETQWGGFPLSMLFREKCRDVFLAPAIAPTAPFSPRLGVITESTQIDLRSCARHRTLCAPKTPLFGLQLAPTELERDPPCDPPLSALSFY